VNYKWKSRRRFFLLMRSRTPPISSEFRGVGGFEHPKPPLSVSHCLIPSIIYLYRLGGLLKIIEMSYLKAWTIFKSEVSTPITRKNFIPIYVLKNLVFGVLVPLPRYVSLLDFISVITLKIPSVFNCHWQWRHTSPIVFLCTCQTPSQPPQDLSYGVKIRDLTCQCVHWFIWRTFWECIVNCDLILKKLNTYYIWNVCYKCIVSFVVKILFSLFIYSYV